MRHYRWMLMMGMLCFVPGGSAAGVEVLLRVQQCQLQPAQPGCANLLNLAAMAAEPEHLQRGRTPGSPLAAPLARAVESYLGSEKEHLPQEDASAPRRVAGSR